MRLKYLGFCHHIGQNVYLVIDDRTGVRDIKRFDSKVLCKLGYYWTWERTDYKIQEESLALRTYHEYRNYATGYHYEQIDKIVKMVKWDTRKPVGFCPETKLPVHCIGIHDSIDIPQWNIVREDHKYLRCTIRYQFDLELFQSIPFFKYSWNTYPDSYHEMSNVIINFRNYRAEKMHKLSWTEGF